MDPLALIRKRLLDAPSILLSSFASASSFESFSSEWRSLYHDVAEVVHHSALNDADVALIQSTANLVSVLGHTFLDIEKETESLTSKFVVDLEAKFVHLSIEDYATPSHDQAPHFTTRQKRIPSRTFPTYNGPAYSWILEHIHDPYPSLEVKRRLSRKSGVATYIVGDWFKDVRRRIGWVSLCKTHFQGSRALAVEAASRFFTKSDAAFSLAPHIAASFQDMQARLKALFAPDEGNDDDNLSFSQELPTHSPIATVSGLHMWQRSPSIGPSSPSSTPSLVFTSGDESDDSIPEIFQQISPLKLNKRKSSIPQTDDISSKRRRSEVSRDPYAAITSTFIPLDIEIPAVPCVSRKRRFSDAAAEWCTDEHPPLTRALPKRKLSISLPSTTRPKQATPRRQVVSDPLPQWFQNTFDIPDLPPMESVELYSAWCSSTPSSDFSELFDPVLSSISSSIDTVPLDQLDLAEPLSPDLSALSDASAEGSSSSQPFRFSLPLPDSTSGSDQIPMTELFKPTSLTSTLHTEEEIAAFIDSILSSVTSPPSDSAEFHSASASNLSTRTSEDS
ncbi:hypothetical protein BXZ70DRAFT_1009150 [Cristinia sonorae]|uniref:KN homeodomain domain-containing protein n=1 Tax=Cristinia sonorae TaxID=1940300 RepID=A0A8K0UL44_9AGAR|nr:hypothetical protein BXZ70DRAFT_1009150 [Cristinia sonorae]